MRLRVEPAMTSLVIPDLIRDPVHPYARMKQDWLDGCVNELSLRPTLHPVTLRRGVKKSSATLTRGRWIKAFKDYQRTPCLWPYGLVQGEFAI